MPSKSIAELEAIVGETHRVVEDLVVEAGKVDEFARAVGDDNPAHCDARAAVRQGFDAIPAPLTFTRTAYFPRYRPEGVTDIRPFDLGFDPARRVHGEHEFEFDRPVVVGDVLSGTISLVDVFQREGSRGGPMTFAVYELVYRDQDDECVLTERWTSIETGRPIDEGDDDE